MTAHSLNSKVERIHVLITITYVWEYLSLKLLHLVQYCGWYRRSNVITWDLMEGGASITLPIQ